MGATAIDVFNSRDGLKKGIDGGRPLFRESFCRCLLVINTNLSGQGKIMNLILFPHLSATMSSSSDYSVRFAGLLPLPLSVSPSDGSIIKSPSALSVPPTLVSSSSSISSTVARLDGAAVDLVGGAEARDLFAFFFQDWVRETRVGLAVCFEFA